MQLLTIDVIASVHELSAMFVDRLWNDAFRGIVN
jgi:hypothetical protein